MRYDIFYPMLHQQKPSGTSIFSLLPSGTPKHVPECPPTREEDVSLHACQQRCIFAPKEWQEWMRTMDGVCEGWVCERLYMQVRTSVHYYFSFSIHKQFCAKYLFYWLQYLAGAYICNNGKRNGIDSPLLWQAA